MASRKFAELTARMDAKFEEQKEKDKTPDSMLLTDRETSLNGIAAEHLYDIGGRLAELLDGLRALMEQINELEQTIHDSASLGVALPTPLPSSSSRERLSSPSQIIVHAASDPTPAPGPSMISPPRRPESSVTSRDAGSINSLSRSSIGSVLRSIKRKVSKARSMSNKSKDRLG